MKHRHQKEPNPHLEYVSESGFLVGHRASVGVVSEAVDHVAQRLEVRVEEEGVFAGESKIAVTELHQLLGPAKIDKVHPRVEVLHLAIWKGR